jgi:GWxTD domain-containing protein
MSIYFKSAHLKALQAKPRLFLLFIAVIYSAGFSIESRADETAQTLFSQAASLLAGGDSTGALGLLDKALELDSKHWEALLERGRVHLAAGDLDAARVDFMNALRSESSRTKAAAHVGLGDVYRVKPHRKWWAIKEYRIAIKADSAFRSEGLYKISETAFELGWTHGYNVACDALTELVRQDPDYKNALKIWWEKIFTQSDDELRDVCRSLEKLVDQGNDNLDLVIYSARIRFRLDQPDSVLASLAKLEAASPEHRRSERLLLEAKCNLSDGDTLGFEERYNESLRCAGQEDDFIHFFRETEPIFNPTEAAKWNSLETAAQKSAFFHTFWKRRDPDPTTEHNERLLTHYQRLHEAKKRYWDYTPHSLFNTSYTYYRLMAPRPIYNYDNPYFDSEYDPDIWWDNCRPLALQQRGLFYIRHGEPDMLYRFGLPWDAAGEAPPYEAWLYDTNYFLFGREKGSYWAKKSYAEQGDITRAMESESFKDPLPTLNHASYGADFKGSGGKLEIEFYQSLPITVNNTPIEKHKATIVVYDESWIELVRKDTESNKVFTGQDSMWFAMNSVTVDPGPIIYALRMNVPGYRSVIRRSIAPSPYSKSGLELSGIILGSPPLPNVQVHQRRGVEILPRPSLAFRHGETIMVYLEVYGLKQNRTRRRFFTEKVTVSLVEEKADENIIKRLFGSKKPRTSLTLSFDRYLSKARGPFAEHFNIDTSDLVPGSYNLLIEVQDKNSRQSKKTGCFFELAERE